MSKKKTLKQQNIKELFKKMNQKSKKKILDMEFIQDVHQLNIQIDNLSKLIKKYTKDERWDYQFKWNTMINDSIQRISKLKWLDKNSKNNIDSVMDNTIWIKFIKLKKKWLIKNAITFWDVKILIRQIWGVNIDSLFYKNEEIKFEKYGDKYVSNVKILLQQNIKKKSNQIILNLYENNNYELIKTQLKRFDNDY